MATRQTKVEREYVQFSKKLITYVMVFWGIIRLTSVIATIINPESGTSMSAIVRGVDDIAMVNVLAYTGNSISEKISLGYFKYKSTETMSELKALSKSNKQNNEEETEDDIENG